MEENTKVNINIQLDAEVLEEAESLFEELGLDLHTAIQMFIKKVLKERGLPFDVKLEKPTFDPIHAILEAMYIINEIISNDLDELLEDDEDDEPTNEEVTKTA